MELKEGWGCNECLFSKKTPKFDWFRLYLGFMDGRGRKRKKREGEKKKEGEKVEEKRKKEVACTSVVVHSGARAVLCSPRLFGLLFFGNLGYLGDGFGLSRWLILGEEKGMKNRGRRRRGRVTIKTHQPNDLPSLISMSFITPHYPNKKNKPKSRFTRMTLNSLT